VFAATTTLKNSVFWDVTPCGSCKNRRLGGNHLLHHQGEKNQRDRSNVSSIFRRVHQLLVIVNVICSPMILFTLIIEAISSSETSVLTRATKNHIAKEVNLHTTFSLNKEKCAYLYFGVHSAGSYQNTKDMLPITITKQVFYYCQKTLFHSSHYRLHVYTNLS
jgi:hypothetical protein